MMRYVAREDARDYSVVVKNKGTNSKPWKWVIYCAARKSPMRSSSENFDTMAAAYKAGRETLKHLFDELPA